MEQFILENVERYTTLVGTFTPPVPKKARDDAVQSRDIIVSTRIRPLLKEELASGFPVGAFIRPNQPGAVDVHELKHAVRGKPTLRSFYFEADNAFGPDSTTEQIYEDVVQHLIPWAWGGGLSTLFAYGQTGSGKTFTVTRLEQLVAKALMEGGLEGKRKIQVSIIELAGNAAHDLLNNRRPVSILEDSFGVVQLAGALEQHVNSTEDILDLIEKATKLRRTESTEKNDESSRSHAICRIRIENLDISTAQDGLLYLIDLAGSEGARDKGQHSKERLLESRAINASLSVLKDCIRGKVETDALLGTSKRKPYVPFRQSALTKVLKHVLDPASMRTSKTVVVACVNPNLADIGATKNTLRYAELLRVFVTKPKDLKYDSAAPMTWDNEQLQTWIRNNSGTPHINSHILAPTESGEALLRLPSAEFEIRCLKTQGVIPEQASAFRSKLWQMHMDFVRPKAAKGPSAGESTDPDTILGHLNTFDASSSRDKYSDTSAVPFKERIRPGMVVSWTPPRGFHMAVPGNLNMAVILCPASSVGSHVRDGGGRPVHAPDKPKDADDERYMCAMVTPAILPGAYDVHLWRQAVVDLEQMNAEVLLEYDSGSRYYYMAV